MTFFGGFGGVDFGIDWKGAWSATQTYDINDAVSYAGSSFLSLTRLNLNNSPAGSPAWNTLAQAGTNGTNGANGTNGTNGTNGNTILSGTGAPASGLGNVGDFYIDTAADAIYGAKTISGWGSSTSLIGPAGSNGTNGTNGSTIDNGTGAPASGLGNIGDFYIDTAAEMIYGPKTISGWGSGTSLVGPSTPASAVIYTPAVPANWTSTPANVAAALDTIAAAQVYTPAVAGHWSTVPTTVAQALDLIAAHLNPV